MPDDVSGAKARMKPVITPPPPIRCVHNYIYQGVKYKVDDYTCPSSSAPYRRYYDAYFCTKCCKLKLVELSVTDDPCQNLKYLATPAPCKDEMGS